ncbi:hypothetical protein [Acidovorax sp. FG27]|uniref:hypothetical protein n=1 Tax=Acidovorax sp. FG27 TaxID=3133652 RepID=UPI0030E99227
MRHLIGLALALVGWAALLRVAGSGLPYLDQEAGAVIGWLLFSPAVLCILPLACWCLRRNAVAAIWLVALAPVAGAGNAVVAAYLGSAAPESRWVVWVLSFLWAVPIAALAFRAWRRQAQPGSDRDQRQ